MAKVVTPKNFKSYGPKVVKPTSNFRISEEYLEKEAKKRAEAQKEAARKEAAKTITDTFSLNNPDKGFKNYLAAKNYKDSVKYNTEYNTVISKDLGVYQAEIDELEKRLKKAEELKNRGQYQKTENGYAYKSAQQEYLDLYGYKSIDDLKRALTNLKVNRQTAELHKKLKNFSSVTDEKSTIYDPDFEKHSGVNSKYADSNQYKYINDIDGYRKEISDWYTKNATYTDDSGRVWNTVKPAELTGNYDYMSDDEIALYNYYYSKYGKKKANEYLEALQKELNTRSALKIREQSDTTAERLLFGASAGLDQFKQGVGNLFNTSDEYITPTDTQIASGMIREDLADSGAKLPEWMGGASIGQIAYDSINTTANMLPSILTSSVVGLINPAVGSVVGAGLMGASASGNAYQEMLNLGYDKGQARIYSVLVGASEAALSAAFSGIDKLGGGATSKFLKNIVSGVDNGLAKFAITWGGKMLSEGFEESMQEILTPLFENIALGYKKNGFSDINWSEVVYSGLLGIVSSAPFGAVEAAESVREKNYNAETPFAKQVDDVINGTHDVNYDLYVSKTPKIFTDLGFSDAPLLMRNSKISEILEKHPEMSVDTIKQIPNALQNPILILKSKTHPTESVVAITDIETDKGNMVVPVWVNQQGNYIDIDLGEGIKKEANFVASAYGRNLKTILEYANENDGFLYQNSDIEKVRQLLTQYGLQLPTPLKLSDSNITIPQENSDVNTNISTKAENNTDMKKYWADVIAQAEQQNTELHSEADGDIITDNENNDVRSGDNELYKQGTVGRSAEGYKTQGGVNARRTSGENRVFGETEEEFTKRTQSEGNTNRRIVKYGNSALSYAERSVDNSPTGKAIQILNKAGIKAVYCDGDIETNENGVTKIHADALTAPDGTVYISSNSPLSEFEISTHESVHAKDKANSEVFIEYESAVTENILIDSEKFFEICSLINDNHYGGKYDVEDISNAGLFLKEILAYINQFVMTDPQFAEETFGGMFSDWNAVVEAVHKFNSDVGLNIPETSVLQSSAKDGVRGFRDSSDKEIYRDLTHQESIEALIGERKNAKQRHITDIAAKLDSGLKIAWVDKASPKLNGKNGKYVREINTIYLAKDMSLPEMYVEVFKHEFVHRLESKATYKAFKDYLFKRSRAFEEYVLSQLKVITGEDFKGSREAAIAELTNYYYNSFVNDKTLGKPIRDRFTLEDAEREIVADFGGEVLFKGSENRADIAQALSENDAEAIGSIEGRLDALEELKNDDRNLFQKLWDVIKDFIASLKMVAQNKRLVEDLEYIEQRMARVYNSKDTKKATKQSGGEQYSIQYVEAEANNDIEQLVSKINSGEFKANEKIYFNDVSEKVAQEIHNLTGIDVSGFKTAIEARQLEHILKDHGENGKADHSLSDTKNIAKMEYVLNSPDNISLAGKTQAYSYMKDGRNRTADTVLYEKIIGDNSYYVVQAVADTKAKTLYVVTAFIGKSGYKKEATQLINANSPDATSKDGSALASNNKIPYKEDSVKNNISTENENYSEDGPFSSGSPMQIARENLAKYENGELTREQYLEENERLWGEAIQKYGSIEEGENAQAPIQTPKAVDEGKLTERFVRTIIETGRLTDEALENIEGKVLVGDFAYKVSSDEASIKKADTAIKNGTAEDIWESTVNSDKYIRKENIAIGEQLLADAIDKGDTKRVLELSSELADIFTRAGQVVQAAQLLKQMSGAGRLISAQRAVKTLNRDLAEKYGVARRPIKISPEAAERLAKAKTQKGIEHAYGEIMQEVADQMPSTFIDKFNAWRYWAMLCGPRTHIRNIVGNAIFMPMVRMKNSIAYVLEAAAVKMGKLDSADRTKSIVIKKEYADFARNDGKNTEVKELLKGNKYNDKSVIREKQKIFKTETLNFITDFNSNLLEAEDMLFKNKHYIHALASYLQSRKADINNVSEQLLAEARVYAVREAKKATFNDENALANSIQRFGNKNLAATIAVEGVLPYKRTPLNIIRRGVEYSPIGLGATLTKGFYDVKKGKITVTEYIDGLASGLTGTGIMLVGMFLANLGVIVGGMGDDDESIFEKLMGKQEYSIEIFGKSYTIDWACPAVIPFMLGAEIINTMREGEALNLADVLNVAGNILEPITELSCLSGMQGVIESAKYADGSQALLAIVSDVVTSYAMQMIPSLSGAVARTVDPTQRSWYIDKNSKLFDTTTQTVWNNIRSKIPVLTYTQAPKINAWGQEVSRGEAAERLAENFISPGYYSEVDYNDMNNELLRLGKATGENVYPKTAAKSFSVNGETKHLTADEYVTYAKAKGQYSHDYIAEFMAESSYKKLTDTEKAKVIAGLYEYANAKAKTTVSDYDLLDRYKTVTRWERNGNSAVDYYIAKAIKD